MQSIYPKLNPIRFGLYFLLFLSVPVIFIKLQVFIPRISACTHYLYECCNLPKCQGGDCYGIADPNVDTFEECKSFCKNQVSGNGGLGKYCCSKCADHCQVDSQCGSGCTCIADPNGNYCYCPGGGSGGGGGGGGGGGHTNHPPTCSISFPTDGLGTVLYDAKEYYDSSGNVVVHQPTVRTGQINTSDPDGDSVSVQSLTVDRNCAQLSLNGKIFNLTPQGHATGVTPVDLGNYLHKYESDMPFLGLAFPKKSP